MEDPEDMNKFLKYTLVVYALQFVETLLSSTRGYLWNATPLTEMAKLLNNLKMTRPRITFKVQNYHFETRSREVTTEDEDGNETTKTEYYEERVDTYSTSE